MRVFRRRMHPGPTDLRSLNALLTTASWAIVALVFLVSGIAKVVSPSGTTPLAFAGLGDRYPFFLRGLGALEVLLAMAIVRRRSRVRGLCVAAASLVAFSVFVAWNATDFSFVGNCGCFGGLRVSSGYYLWLVLRNALAAILATAGAAAAARGGWRASPTSWRLTGVFVAGLLVPVIVGEMRLRAYSYDTIGAMLDAQELDGFQGRRLPAFDLVAADGRLISSVELFRPGDRLVFLSRSCPHCRALGPELSGLSAAQAPNGRRVVLVLIDSAVVPPEWPRSLGCGDLPVYATRDRLAVARLGASSVPRFIALGDDGEVVFNESFPLAPSFWKSLDLVDRRVEGVAAEVWNRIAAGIFGAGAECRRRPEIAGGIGIAVVQRGDVGVGRLVVVHEGARTGDEVEMALGLDPEGRIRGVVPLSAGAYVRTFFPAVAFVDSLRGLSPADAESLTLRHLSASRLEWPVWRALQQGLHRLRDAAADSSTGIRPPVPVPRG